MNTWIYLVSLTALQAFGSCSSLQQSCQDNFENWYPDGDYCYQAVVSGGAHYPEAQSQCLKLNATLITLHSSEQEKAIRAKLIETFSETYPYWWLGLSRSDDGEWSWVDGSKVDYVNWETGNDTRFKCVVLTTPQSQYTWLPAYCEDFFSYVVCQAPKYTPAPTASTTVSLPTTEPDVLGCSHFSRGQCQNDQEDTIIQTEESDPVDCQRLCSGIYFNECKSFSFNFHSGLCTLKSSTVQAQDLCLQLGGPIYPSIGSCQAKGCQDFYRSDCDESSTLIPIDTIEHVGNPSDCQKFCQDHHLECDQWRLEGQQCHLYHHAESCNVLNGPSDPSIEECI